MEKFKKYDFKELKLLIWYKIVRFHHIRLIFSHNILKNGFSLENCRQYKFEFKIFRHTYTVLIEGHKISVFSNFQESIILNHIKAQIWAISAFVYLNSSQFLFYSILHFTEYDLESYQINKTARGETTKNVEFKIFLKISKFSHFKQTQTKLEKTMIVPKGKSNSKFDYTTVYCNFKVSRILRLYIMSQFFVDF